MLPLTFSERVHLPRIPFITLPCTFAPASAVSAPTLAGGGGERAETEGWTNRQDTRSHIAHLLESLLASHGRIVFTARTRPAFRSPQSLRRPSEDVTELTSVMVITTSLVGACQHHLRGPLTHHLLGVCIHSCMHSDCTVLSTPQLSQTFETSESGSLC